LTSWKPVNFSRRTLLHGVSKYYAVTLVVAVVCDVCLLWNSFSCRSGISCCNNREKWKINYKNWKHHHQGSCLS